MQSSDQEVLIEVRIDKVKTITVEVLSCLNDLYRRVDFNVAELLLAFNEIMETQGGISKYFSKMR